jgi:hypothetical protein
MTLTRDDIMAMAPHELLVAIARAKGWTYIHPKLLTGYPPDSIIPPEEQLPPIWPPRLSCHRPPDWPRDIAAAWELVEEMRPNFYQIDIICWDHNNEWCVQCNPRHGHDEIIVPTYGKGATAPLAISRAYLLWKLGK